VDDGGNARADSRAQHKSADLPAPLRASAQTAFAAVHATARHDVGEASREDFIDRSVTKYTVPAQDFSAPPHGWLGEFEADEVYGLNFSGSPHLHAVKVIKHWIELADILTSGLKDYLGRPITINDTITFQMVRCSQLDNPESEHTLWIHKDDARAVALAHHGSEEKLADAMRASKHAHLLQDDEAETAVSSDAEMSEQLSANADANVPAPAPAPSPTMTTVAASRCADVIPYVIPLDAGVKSHLSSMGWKRVPEASRQHGISFSACRHLYTINVKRRGLAGNVLEIHMHPRRMWDSEISLSTAWIRDHDAQRELERKRLADEKKQEMRKRKREAIENKRHQRRRELQNALLLVDADPNQLTDESFQKAGVLAMMQKYESAGERSIATVVRSAAATKFLHTHTAFLDICHTYRVQNRASNKAADMVKLALHPCGNEWPLVMPWTTWTIDNHYLVSSARFKEAVRTWLLVARRGITASGEVSIPLTNELVLKVVEELAAVVIAEFTTMQPRLPDVF
jgi:hypothetical protein